MKYDYHNIKTILKGEATGEAPQPLLIEAGRIPAKQLITQLREENYGGMTKTMVDAIVEARDVLARTQDPQLLDFILDKAMYKDMLELAQAFGNRYTYSYVRLMIDSVNLRTAVRLRRMGKGGRGFAACSDQRRYRKHEPAFKRNYAGSHRKYLWFRRAFSGSSRGGRGPQRGGYLGCRGFSLR